MLFSFEQQQKSVHEMDMSMALLCLSVFAPS